MRSPGPLARLIRLALLLAAGTLAGLLLAEGAVRLLMPQSLLHDPDAFDPDPLLGGRLRPGFSGRFTSPEYATRWEVNLHGHRGPEAAATPGRPRIAALGDSFTFGYGVEEEEAWPRVLEGELRAAGLPETEVINLGIGGYGTVQEVAWLQEHLDHGLAPDLVILAFYPGNDLSDSLRGLQASQGASGMAAPPPPSRMQRLKRWLGSTLQLYSLVSERADSLLIRLGLRNVVYPEEVDVLRSVQPEHIARGWEAAGSALRGLASLGREHGFAVVVLGIPMRHQVVEASWRRVRDFYRRTAGEDLAGVDPDAPRERLAALCAEEGLPLLDLAPGFGSLADSSALYFRRDQHWTRRGHLEAATDLAAFLLAEPELLGMPGPSADADAHPGGGPPVDAQDGGRRLQVGKR